VTNVFAVVGEHRREPGRLLLLGEDGRYYAYRADGAPMEVEPGAAWNLDDEAVVAAQNNAPAKSRTVGQEPEPASRTLAARARWRTPARQQPPG
jgi:hypothetical protein